MSDPIAQISDILGAPKGWLRKPSSAELIAEARQVADLYATSPDSRRFDTRLLREMADSLEASPRTILQAVLNDVHPAALSDGYTHFLACVRHVGEQYGVSDL